MRLRIPIACVLVILMMKTSAQEGTLTLQQSIETAINNNLTVKQSELQMQTANITHKQAKAYILPDLIGYVDHGTNQGRSIDPFTNTYSNQQINFASYNLSSNVTLFNGFQLLNTVRQQALAYNAAKMELQQTRDNITLQVILAYLQILNNEEQLTQAESQATLSRRQVERLEVLNNQGAIAPALLYDLRGQLANDELAIVNTRNSLDAARLALSQLMNVPYSQTLKVEKLTADQMSLVYEGNPESIYNAAMSQLALVKAADYRKESAQKAVKVARGRYSPGIFLSGNLNTNYSSLARTETLLGVTDVATSDYVTVNGDKVSVFTQRSNFASSRISYGDQFRNNYSTSIAVGIRIPIVNAFLARNAVAQAKANLKNAEFVAQTTRTQLRQAIEQAYFNMKAAQDRYRVLQNQVAAFSESFRAAEVRFNAGLGTSVDYLVAKNNLDRANINLVSARYDYVLRTRVLDYYQSKPLF